MSKYEPDRINGLLVPPLVLVGDTVWPGTHTGTIHVERGTLTLRGRNLGTIAVHRGAGLLIEGTQAGSVSIGQGGRVTVRGVLNGSTSLEREATVIVEAGGRLAGSLANEGRVVVRGVYAGERRGSGEFLLEEAGRIKRPEFINGVATYVWREFE